MIIHHETGFCLMEVLVSLVLFSFILLGFVAMEIYSLRSLRNSYYLNVATWQLNNMAERLRALGDHFGIEQQIQIWNRENQKILPTSNGIVSGHYPFYNITLYWGETSWESQTIEVQHS